MSASDRPNGVPGRTNHYVVPVGAATVHWGYFSRSLKPILFVESGDFVTIETLTHHAYDDHALACFGPAAARSITGRASPRRAESGRARSFVSATEQSSRLPGSWPNRLRTRLAVRLAVLS